MVNPTEEVHSEFLSACERLSALQPNSKLLIACSAGGDSMALLDLAWRESKDRNWEIAVAHFDHAQRPESEEEAEFVAGRCWTLDLQIFSERLVAEVGAKPGALTEDQMRAARYAFFHRAAATFNCDTLLLAHQSDDRAETFLIRLLAGSGPTGLSSIRAVDKVGELNLVRPLLRLRRRQLRDYLIQRGFTWREDPSNDNPAFQRVWVRNRILPLFEERVGLDVAPRIVRAAELAEEEAGALTEAADFLIQVLTAAANPPAISRFSLHHEFWQRASGPLRRRMMREWLWALRQKPYPPGFKAVEELMNFAERATNDSWLKTVENIRILKREGYLFAHPAEDKRDKNA